MLKVSFHVMVLVLLCTALHAAVTAILAERASRIDHRQRERPSFLTRAFFVPGLVLLMLVVLLIEASLWGFYYFHSGRISTLEESVYFSLVTMTTVGYGDITLIGSGRVIAGIEAALGVVLFGWTTSIIFAAVQAIYLTPLRNAPRPGHHREN